MVMGVGLLSSRSKTAVRTWWVDGRLNSPYIDFLDKLASLFE